MKKIIAVALLFAPAIASAQEAITDVNSLTSKLTAIGNTFIEILIAFAVLYIIFNVVRFIMKADNPEERSNIGKAILWGIVGLFVILSIWGLVNILSNTFRTNTNAPTQNFPTLTYPPQVP
jgi:heme/copper-type cytochrome/quinol oxidase subunit 4